MEKSDIEISQQWNAIYNKKFLEKNAAITYTKKSMAAPEMREKRLEINSEEVLRKM